MNYGQILLEALVSAGVPDDPEGEATLGQLLAEGERRPRFCLAVTQVVAREQKQVDANVFNLFGRLFGNFTMYTGASLTLDTAVFFLTHWAALRRRIWAAFEAAGLDGKEQIDPRDAEFRTLADELDVENTEAFVADGVARQKKTGDKDRPSLCGWICFWLAKHEPATFQHLTEEEVTA